MFSPLPVSWKRRHSNTPGGLSLKVLRSQEGHKAGTGEYIQERIKEIKGNSIIKQQPHGSLWQLPEPRHGGDWGRRCGQRQTGILCSLPETNRVHHPALSTLHRTTWASPSHHLPAMKTPSFGGPQSCHLPNPGGRDTCDREERLDGTTVDHPTGEKKENVVSS